MAAQLWYRCSASQIRCMHVVGVVVTATCFAANCLPFGRGRQVEHVHALVVVEVCLLGHVRLQISSLVYEVCAGPNSTAAQCQDGTPYGNMKSHGAPRSAMRDTATRADNRCESSTHIPSPDSDDPRRAYSAVHSLKSSLSSLVSSRRKQENNKRLQKKGDE